MTEFEKLPIASWKVGGVSVRFPVVTIGETGGNRLVPREFPYREGAKYDDTGAKPKTWTMQAVFNNSVLEPGMGQTEALYPTVLNKLLATFDKHETGDLVVPTRGRVRARAQDYTRNEMAERRDEAIVDLVFVEDNEERTGAQTFEAPSANASASRLAETTVFSAQSDGVWDTSIQDLFAFAAELEAVANFPGDTVGDVDQSAGQMIAAANRVGDAFTNAAEGNDVLNDPDSSQTQRKLQQSKDIAGRARAQARGGLPPVVTRLADSDTTLFAIAADLGQEADQVIALNRDLDPLDVPEGTVVRVFDA
jgi:prophage DNA circulation protein